MPNPLTKINYTLSNIYEQLKIHNALGHPTFNFGDEMDSVKLYYYLVASMPFIRSINSYLPKHELELALAMIKLPLMQDYRIENYGYSWGLISHTLHLIDIYIQRRPDSESKLLDELHDAIKNIPIKSLIQWITEHISLKNSK
ncbi:hypothetical protein N9Q05_00440, partial [bacterium]|nr:hypothetical protein [bacterium]